MGHKKVCKAKGVECRNCGKTGHYARMCRLKISETKKNNSANRKVNAIRTESPWSSSEEESAEEVENLHIDGKTPKNKPFVLKGKFNRKPFHALIDTGSPITIFTKAHAEKIFGKHFKMKPLDKEEKHVDYSSNKIEFLGAIIGQVESGAKKLDKVRGLVAENGTRTEIGRDWLRGLGIKLKTEGGKCHSPLPDWNAVVDESATEEAMVVPQNSQKVFWIVNSRKIEKTLTGSTKYSSALRKS